MENEIFLSAVGRIADRSLRVVDVITAAERLRAMGREDQAIQIYQLWTAANTENQALPMVLFNLAALLSGSGDVQGAKDALTRAIKVKPDFLPPYVNLGNVHEKLGDKVAAINCWSEVVNRLTQIDPASLSYKKTALKQIGRVFEGSLLLAEAEDALRQGLELDTTQKDVIEHYISLRMTQCKWPVIFSSEWVGRNVLLSGMGPLSMSAYTDDPLLQLAAAHRYNKTIAHPGIDLRPDRKKHAKRGKRRLRIGYLSSDLRSHAVGFLMSEMFELHDRERVEVFAYYCGIPSAGDPIQERISASVEHWIDITQMDDKTAAKRMADDGIDILVDVNGYTRDARTGVIAARPAPIIVNWLGYPGTMASPYHHYIIADDWIVPQENELYFTEKVLRLPCYQPNDRKRTVAEVSPTRAEMGLPEDAVVFCCFNGTHKISNYSFFRWMQILREVPGSVLWQLSTSNSTEARLREEAKKHGVEPERLIFAGKIPNPQHMARYQLADLFLDTAPYGAHTTASDALWMGVPILTYSGRGFASRVCGSLARAAGIGDMVCSSVEDYVARAIELGRNPSMIADLKRRLAESRRDCVMFNMEMLVNQLEGLFEDMWNDYLTDRLPQPDLRNLDIYFEIGIEVDHEKEEMMLVDDYEERYLRRIREIHNFRPVGPDVRLWPDDRLRKDPPSQ